MRPARVFIPSPTWVNHHAIWAQTGVSRIHYPYYAPKTRSVDLDGMLSVLEDKAEHNDVLVLQACAHNPTGVDLSQAQWAQVVGIVKRKRVCVVIDSAYRARSRNAHGHAMRAFFLVKSQKQTKFTWNYLALQHL
jgi:aspartate/tyrosine/aromatic aminotransferase